MINIDDPSKVETTWPLWRLGFRPFFLGGAALAVLLIPYWLTLWYYPELINRPFWSPVIPLWWHPHEMLFGFAMAIVAGFTLTAVQTWTGQPGLKGWPLAGLFGLWLGARLVLMLPYAIPLWLPALLDTSFLLLTAARLGWSIWRVRQWRNAAFPLLLTLAALLNLLSYWALYQRDMVLASTLWQGMIWWMALLITFVGGRVIPFFTAVRLKLPKADPIRALDWVLFSALAVLALNALFSVLPEPLWRATLLLAGGLQLVRQSRWHGHKTRGEPLLWSLHLSYLCITVTLLALAITGSDEVAQRQLLHLLAVGAIGGMCLAMIARVSLGHTGHNLYEGPWMAPAFAMVLSAALVRSLLPLWLPVHTELWHWLAGTLWCGAFALFLWHYSGLLSRPRLDGRPG
ncbi:NnrS family protein [Ferrimonas balearica]|uniref:NnrS family protein n=1 Tax=Ferrimonas balearica TaxID=44012 RepID=UPI001C57CAE5|nr:NnrS family protein [Ferrimonas balearica]MBW3139680.1 NnrS family protein [Ferrimonas balearica]